MFVASDDFIRRVNGRGLRTISAWVSASRHALDARCKGKERGTPQHRTGRHAGLDAARYRASSTSRVYFERLRSRRPAIANATPAPAATPNTKPNRKPQGRTSDVEPRMAERAIPAPAIAARADPSEILCRASILIPFKCLLNDHGPNCEANLMGVVSLELIPHFGSPTKTGTHDRPRQLLAVARPPNTDPGSTPAGCQVPIQSQ
jgi:hypothetical protein